jgi:putative ABC transport system permease protein
MFFNIWDCNGGMNVKIRLTNKKSKWRISVILLVIFLLLPISFLSLTNASVTIKRNIYDFSRGSYDILLRPQDSHTPIEEEFGLVEENYLGNGHGGITIEQWRNVLERTDIEVAAPVAALGLYRAAQGTFSLPERKDASIRYTINYSTTDGLKTYQMGEKLISYIIPDDEHPFGYTTIVSPSIGPNVVRGDIPYFEYPSSYHQVVAVDPEQEGKLTGEELSVLNDSRSGLVDGFKGVPILSLQNTKNPLKAKIKLETLNITDTELSKLKERYNIKYTNDGGWTFESILVTDQQQYEQVMNEMEKIKGESSKTVELDFSKLASPFYDNMFYADENYHFDNLEDGPVMGVGAGMTAVFNQASHFVAEPVEYNINNDKISIPLVERDIQTGIPLYRKIDERINYVLKKRSNQIEKGEGIQFLHSGYFKGMDNSEELAASPLGIYGIHKTYLAKDKDKIIYPTSLPGSFINTPAHGLISINWAEQLKGEAPIDAIRVRVEGIEGYDKRASEKIKQIAKEMEKDGFAVYIVAGASRKEMTIEVEGIGEVVQAWTSLGAADTIVESWDIVKIVLSTIFGLVSFVYLLFSFRQLKRIREEDEQLLFSFGWDETNIRRLRWKEWVSLMGYPFITALVIFIVYNLINQKIFLIISLFAVFLFTVLLLGLVELIVRRNDTNTERIREIHGSVTWKSIWHYRQFIIFSNIQVIIMAFIANFLTLFLVREKARTTETTLGLYVHGDVDWFYSTILVILYTLICLTVIESLLSLWKKRSEEIFLFHHIGWGKKSLYVFYLREVLFWTVGAVLAGSVSACLVYQSLFGNIQAVVWNLFLITLIVVLIILCLSLLILSFVLRAQFTNKREEGYNGTRGKKLEQNI